MSAHTYEAVLRGLASEYGTFPLSSIQERLWFLSQLDPHDPAYHMAGAVRLRGPLDLERLDDAVRALAQRHEALRTVFRELDGLPVQVVLPLSRAALDVRQLGDGEGDPQVVVAAEARKPFDLRSGAVRFACLRMGSADHILMVTVHHVVCDGISVEILVRDLSALYGPGPALAPLPVQFADFALWERARIDQGAFDEDLRWWREALAGIPTTLPLPSHAARGTHPFTVPGPVAGRARRLAVEEGTTPFVVALAAFSAALAAHLGQPEFVVGTPVAGRPLPEVRDVVGPFANTCPLPVRLDPRGSLRDSVRALRGTVAHALAHAAVPFERIVDAVGAPRPAGRTPLVQALLAWRPDGGIAALELAGISVTEVPVELGAPKFDISLEVGEAPKGWTARLEFARLAPDDAVELARSWVTLLASSPDSPFAIEVGAMRGPEAGLELAAPVEGAEDELRDAAEVAVAEAWRDVLGAPVGRNEDFFMAGGHSLMGARILARLRARTGADLPLAALFEARTVAALARRVSAARRATLEPIPIASPGSAVLSSAQQGHWLVHRLDPASVAYNLTGALRVQGPVDVDALASALRALVARHPALRTSLCVVDGTPLQVVGEVPALEFEACALGELPSSDVDAALRATADRLAARPFDLSSDPALRAVWVDGGTGGGGLVLGTTHAAADGSHAIFLAELEHAYAVATGATPPRPAPRISYTDYAAWQRARLPEVVLEHLPYWKERLAAVGESLEIPTDRPRPPVRTGRGETSTFMLDAPLAGRVRGFARAQGATVHMVLLAAWAILLHRLSGQNRFTIGLPVQVRPPEAEDVIGCFVNPVVLCTDLSGEPTFVEALQRVRAQVLDAYARAELPFDALVEALGRPRDLSRTPLFQMMFVFAEALAPPRLGAVATRFLEWSPSIARFDVLWAMRSLQDGRLGGSVEYASDLFDPSTVEQMIRAYEVLLTAGVDTPHTPAAALPLLRPAERRRLLTDWNRTAREVEGPLTLHQRFEQAADRAPGAPAVSFRDKTWSYAAVEERANRWAHLLASCGVGRGERVGFWANRCGESVEALLGILKAGAAYVPMAAGWPPARVERVARELGLRVIITQEPFAAALDAMDLPRLVHRLPLDGQAAARRLASVPFTRPAPTVGADDCAYVIFTSGSTGTPKGVVVRHGRAANLVDWVNRTFRVRATDRLLFVTSYCFDLSVYDLFGILGAGGSVRVAEADDLRDPARLWSFLQSDGITFWDSAPATLAQLAPLLLSHPRDPDSPLRLVFLSGDWIPLALPGQLRRVFPGAEVVSLGGATEAVIWSNFHRLGDVAPHWHSIPYGRPIQNARYYVLDTRLEPCPVGVAGHLYIGGPVLADGYTDPVLTAERFIPDPHAGCAGAVMYRTGDRARFWPDGTMELLGRVDQQVKVRGHRIERGEIETVLGQHPAVAACAVLPRPDGQGDLRLIAWYVPRGEPVPTTGLRAHLAAQLPDYMIPAAFVAVSAIPCTDNGKLDPGRLPDPEPARPALAAAYVPPRDELEEMVAGAWCRVLGVDRVSADDNFFDLGGHSAAMIRVQAALEEALGRPVPIIQMFRHTTVETLARHLSAGASPPPVDDGLGERRLLVERNRLARKRLRGE